VAWWPWWPVTVARPAWCPRSLHPDRTTYRPTKVADVELGINPAYLRRLREQRPELWDANVNRSLRATTSSATR
jgi:hypothetical protein